MNATCKVCRDTGQSLRGSGIYDCQALGCNAATERVKLEESLPAAEVSHPLDTLWVGYQAGKAAALEQAAKECLDAAEAYDKLGMLAGNAAAMACETRIRALKP